jgi:hypothetical protein
MRSPIRYFSSDYFEARDKFLDACNIAGASVNQFLNPNAVGPDGSELYTDIAYIGPIDAPLLFIVASGTHGVEGFLGSGCQVGYLTEKLYQDRPDGSAIVLVHAMNPFGFAHVRRVNEDNVDLNRNFVDHMIPYPEKPDYEFVHSWLVPEDWDGPSRSDSDKAIATYIEERGFSAYQSAVSSGQYKHADGVFYGGNQPSWSNNNWRQFLTGSVSDRQHVGFLDLHTGLGPYGYGEPIFLSWPDMAQYERARQWYGEDVTAPEAGDSTSAAVQGVVASAFHDLGAKCEITAIALEYGTIPVEDVLEAVRADNWLYVHGRLNSVIGREIKQQIRDAFYCDADDWKHLVWDRAVDILQKGFVGLEG